MSLYRAWVLAAAWSRACSEEAAPSQPSVTETATTRGPERERVEAPTSTAGPTVAPSSSAPRCPENAVLVEGGTFRMGAADGVANAAPVHDERVSAFCLDKTEVTVEAYRSCVEAGVCTKPLVGGLCTFGRKGTDPKPINCVEWAAAKAYCAWKGARLPSEAEWEFAARGSDGRIYPWGDAPPAKQLCWDGTTNDLGYGNRHDPCDAGAYPGDVSPFGALDMAGGVSEWTANEVRRGGSWGSKSSAHLVRATARGTSEFHIYRVGLFVGFRCAR